MSATELRLQESLPTLLDLWHLGMAEIGATPETPLSFREFLTRAAPHFIWYRHCEELASVLQRVADDELHHVMVFMPPRHGKSEEISRLFSAYYLYRHPDRWVGITSYAADLSYTLSRAAREAFTRAGGILKSSAFAVKHWETIHRGGLWAAGVGGPITGKGFHLGIIDDPLKNADDASSEIIREKQKDWYRSTFSTRGEPGAATVIVQTRWHEDDLSGWLLSEIDEEEPDGWYILNLPAIAEPLPTYPSTCTVHPDWRSPGDALCSERYSQEKLARIATRIGQHFWAALFQQRPSPRGGGLFKVGAVSFLDAVPEAITARCRRWDIAASAGKNDYTAGVLLASLPGGRWLVEDVVRGQWGPEERDRQIRLAAELDRARGPVTQVVPQDPGAAGVDLAASLIRLLAGHRVEAVRETGDKATRADPFASQWNAGNVSVLRADWNRAFLEEIEHFPQGRHDDMVDAAGGAFSILSSRPLVSQRGAVGGERAVIKPPPALTPARALAPQRPALTPRRF